MAAWGCKEDPGLVGLLDCIDCGSIHMLYAISRAWSSDIGFPKLTNAFHRLLVPRLLQVSYYR